MIDPHTITCSSELHDSCGVVFRHEGRILRALYPRGERMFQLLTEDGWMERLISTGLVRMSRTADTLPDYETVLECEKIDTIIPPTKWSTGMLCEAGQVLCALSQELLTRGLLIWDLKHFFNMAYCARRGPIFMDLGAIHSVEELENNVLSTSRTALLDHIATSFYVPLWLTLGWPGRFDATKRFVSYRREGPEAFDLPAALLRRITLGWKAVPGLGRGALLLRAGRYQEFFGVIAEKLKAWADSLAVRVDPSPVWNSQTGSAETERGKIIALMEKAVGSLHDKTCFDLNPNQGYGLAIAHNTNGSNYLVTGSETDADDLFASRQSMRKPFLPVVCDIWHRSLKPVFALREKADVAFILPDVFEAAGTARVPLDFVGQVLSLLTRSEAVVGVRNTTESRFPGFLSPPPGAGSPAEFVQGTIGKYFRNRELIDQGPDGIALLVFRK